MAISEELRIELCYKHKDLDLPKRFPGYVFNDYLNFPARKCRIKNCQEDAFYTVIGLNFPDAVGEIKRETAVCKGTMEIFMEAKTILDGGPALDRLTRYLRTRIIPSLHKEVTADMLLRHHAQCILDKLGIDKEISLSDIDKHAILQELGLYPEVIE
jgi:hypothetical protein